MGIHTSAETGGDTWSNEKVCPESPHHHTWSKLFEDPPFSSTRNIISS